MSNHERIEALLMAVVAAAIGAKAFYRAVADGQSWGWIGCGLAWAVAGALVGRACK